MSPARVKTFLAADPFEPFTIVKGDGQEVDVLSRDLALLHPGGRTLYVVSPKFAGAKTEEEFEDHNIDVFLITDIIKPVRRKKHRRKAG
ncbi:MAG: hypothetical protein IT447_06680 [Phycisphaerales bacterium]|jgi:hypothetical protein|nr:hypothetical protein [Phycisphaerales bacterium]